MKPYRFPVSHNIHYVKLDTYKKRGKGGVSRKKNELFEHGEFNIMDIMQRSID